MGGASRDRIHRARIHRARIHREQMPDSAHTAARPAARTTMAGIPIKDIRAAAVSAGMIPT